MQNRRALTVGMVTLVTFVAFEAVAVTAAMPTVARALDGLALYGFAFGGPFAAGIVATVAAGTWADRRGPGRPILAGVALFCLGLLGAGLAPDMWTLIAGRFVQGFGGGLITVAFYVVVGRAYPAAAHPKVFSALSAAWVLPAIAGPAVAGVIVEHLGWRWVFLLISIATVPAAALIWPHVHRIEGLAGTAPNTRIPWAVGVAAGVVLLHLGGQRTGLDGVAAIAGGLLVVAVCAPRLLPAGTFTARRGLPDVILLRGFANAAFVQADILIPLLLTRERGLSPTLAGLTLTTGAVCWAAGSWIYARQGQRLTPATRLRIGLAGIAVGVGSAIALVAPAVPVVVVVVLGWSVAGFGMGLASPTLSALSLQLSAPGEQGVNSSALAVGDSLLTTAVLAVGGSVFAALVGSGPPAYLAAFLIALVPAVAGVLVAGRVTVRTPAPALAAKA